MASDDPADHTGRGRPSGPGRAHRHRAHRRRHLHRFGHSRLPWARRSGLYNQRPYGPNLPGSTSATRPFAAGPGRPGVPTQPGRQSLTLATRAGRAQQVSIETWVITQNIDGLHQKSGIPADRVLELHGTMFGAVCVGCGDQRPMADVLVRVEAGEEDPACEICGGHTEVGDGHVRRERSTPRPSNAPSRWPAAATFSWRSAAPSWSNLPRPFAGSQ